MSLLKNILNKKQIKQKEYHDGLNKKLFNLEINQDVLVQKGQRNWIFGKIVNRCEKPKTYKVTTEDEGTYIKETIKPRNNCFNSPGERNGAQSAKSEHIQ